MPAQRRWQVLLAPIIILWTNVNLCGALPVPDDELDTSSRLLGSSVAASVSLLNPERSEESRNINRHGSININALKNSNDLPASPADLLRPDRFQFYTYNDRGDMITRQMTVAEIQALIAGGGAGHAPMEIHEPQKADDVFTGGKKVMDVVQKVQNVLKSAMDKPATIIGSVPTIPQQANAEWSSILPGILSGDVGTLPANEEAVIAAYIPDEAGPQPDRESQIESDPNGLYKENMGAIEDAEVQEMQKIRPDLHMYPEKPMVPVPVITAEEKLTSTQHPQTGTPLFQIVNVITSDDSESKTEAQKEDQNTQTVQPMIVNETTSSMVDHTRPITDTQYVQIASSTVPQNEDGTFTKFHYTKPAPVENTELQSSTSTKVEQIVSSTTRPVTSNVTPKEPQSTVLDQSTFGTSTASGPASFGNILTGALDSIAADLMSNQPAKLPVMIDENVVVATTESAQVTRLRTKATTQKSEEGTEIIRMSTQGSNVKASPTTLTLTMSGAKEPVYQILPELKPNKSTPPSSVGLYTKEIVRTTDSKLQPVSSYRSSTTLSMSSTTPSYESSTFSETKKTSTEKVSLSSDESQKTDLTGSKDQTQLETRPLETLNVELSNSLSSVINQVSETVPSILHVPALNDAPKVPMMHGNTKNKITAGKGTTTTLPTPGIKQEHQEAEKFEEGNINGSTNVDTNKEEAVKISSTNSSLSMNPNLLGIDDRDSSEKIGGTKYSVISKPIDNSEGSSTLKSDVPVPITLDKSIVTTTLPSAIELSVTEAKTTKSPISESVKFVTSIVGTTPMPIEIKISSSVESTTLKGVTDKTTVSLKPTSAAADKMKPNETHDTITPEVTLQKPGELVLSILSKPMHASTNFPENPSKVSAQSSISEIEYSKVAPMVMITSQASEVTKNESIVATTSPSPSTASADIKDSFVKVQLADPVSIIHHLLESNPVQSEVPIIEVVTLPSGNDQVTSASNLASGLVAGFLPNTERSEIYQNKKDDESEKKKPLKTTDTILEPTVNVSKTSIADSIKDLQGTTEKVFKSNSTEEKVILREKIKIGSAQKDKEDTKLKETLKEIGKVEASISLVVEEDIPSATTQVVKDSSIKASSTATQNRTNPTIVIETSTKENPEKLIINVTEDQKDNSKPESSIIRINISPEIIQELPEKIQLTDLPILREQEESSPATTPMAESSSDSAVTTTDSLPLDNATTVSSMEKNSAHLMSMQQTTSTERNVSPMMVEASSNKSMNKKKPVLVYPPKETTTANLVTSEKPKDSTTLRIEIVPNTVQSHNQPVASSTPGPVTLPTLTLANRRPEATIATIPNNTPTESETEKPIIRVTESVLLQSSANAKVNDTILDPGLSNLQMKDQSSVISENTKKNEDTVSKPVESTAQTPLEIGTTRAPAQNTLNENAEKIAGTEKPQKKAKPQSATFDLLQMPHVQSTSSAKPTKHSNSQSSTNHNVKQSQHTAALNQKVENTHSEFTDTDDEEHKWALIPHQTRPTTTKIGKPPKDSFANVRPTTQSANSVRKPEDQTPVSQHPEVQLSASHSISGLDVSARNTSSDIVNFSKLCNELGFSFWMATNKGLSTGRSLALSPFGMTSLLAMLFLGARGPTSEQMNEVLRLDDVATFNPHLIFQNVTDTVGLARDQGIANAAFVRELFADKVKVRKLLPFYKEQAQQFYEGLVAEVNFATISDLVRRRTNLLIRKQTGGRIKDFVKTNTVPLRSPLAALSANVFQTDCNSSVASSVGRDGELYFAVSPAVRQRKLVPVPATVWRSNVLAGYEPSLDATAVALGGIDRLVSTIFVIPGQQGNAAPGDTLDRLEQRLVRGAFRDGSWNKLLKVLIPRHGLELQIPKFSHRSVVNATAALKRMGLDELFSGHADLKGINGVGNRLYLADVLQMNLFSTCGDENIANGRHHVETYPSSPLRSLRHHEKEDDKIVEVFAPKDVPTRNNHETDQIHERRRKQSVTSTEKPRLKLDRPFLYFVRHNPTGLILHMGRFNPRLLP